MGRDIALTGMPRSGTTLACAILTGCRDTVALSEPMDVGALPADDRGGAVDMVQAFFDDARAELLAHGTATSKHRGGRIPDNTFVGAPGSRRSTETHGKIVVEPKPRPGFTLAVKHNAAFAALLPDLASRIDTIALVRHPLAVISSWHSIEIAASDGHIPAAERLDARLRTRLASEPDRIGRQLVVRVLDPGDEPAVGDALGVEDQEAGPRQGRRRAGRLRRPAGDDVGADTVDHEASLLRRARGAVR